MIKLRTGKRVGSIDSIFSFILGNPLFESVKATLLLLLMWSHSFISMVQGASPTLLEGWTHMECSPVLGSFLLLMMDPCSAPPASMPLRGRKCCSKVLYLNWNITRDIKSPNEASCVDPCNGAARRAATASASSACRRRRRFDIKRSSRRHAGFLQGWIFLLPPRCPRLSFTSSKGQRKPPVGKKCTAKN